MPEFTLTETITKQDKRVKHYGKAHRHNCTGSVWFTDDAAGRR